MMFLLFFMLLLPGLLFSQAGNIAPLDVTYQPDFENTHTNSAGLAEPAPLGPDGHLLPNRPVPKHFAVLEIGLGYQGRYVPNDQTLNDINGLNVFFGVRMAGTERVYYSVYARFMYQYSTQPASAAFPDEPYNYIGGGAGLGGVGINLFPTLPKEWLLNPGPINSSSPWFGVLEINALDLRFGVPINGMFGGGVYLQYALPFQFRFWKFTVDPVDPRVRLGFGFFTEVAFLVTTGSSADTTITSTGLDVNFGFDLSFGSW